MRYFTGFLIVAIGVLLWMLPVTDSIYSWKTEPRTDSFLVTTAAGVTTGNSTLFKSIYDADIHTLAFSSNCSTDAVTYVSYNTTSKLLNYSGLEADVTRELEISYDTSAFDESSAWETFSDMLPYLCYIVFVLFMCSGIYYMLAPHIKDWLS